MDCREVLGERGVNGSLQGADDGADVEWPADEIGRVGLSRPVLGAVVELPVFAAAAGQRSLGGLS